MRTLRSLVAMGLVTAASLAPAAEVPNLSTPVVRGAIGERMHAYLRWGEQFGFSGVALVAMDEEVVLHQPYGLADREDGTLNRLGTVFSFGYSLKRSSR